MTTMNNRGLLSRVSVMSLLLSLLQVTVGGAAVPVHTYQAGSSQIVIPNIVEGSCPVVNMTAEDHQLFYEFCYNVDRSRNETRDTAYLPRGYDSAVEDFSAFEDSLRNEESVPMSDYCLEYLRPFVCFFFFPFPWPPVTEQTCKTTNVTYAKPCRDFCEKTFQACQNELGRMIASNKAHAADLEHLQCHNFEQEKSLCIRPPPIAPPTGEANISCSTGNASSAACSQSSENADSSSSCNCANVRNSVTQRTFTAYSYSMGEVPHAGVPTFQLCFLILVRRFKSTHAFLCMSLSLCAFTCLVLLVTTSLTSIPQLLVCQLSASKNKMVTLSTLLRSSKSIK